jgi:hypothetical protein
MFYRPSTTYRMVFCTFNISLKVKKAEIRLNTQHVSVTYDHFQVLQSSLKVCTNAAEHARC